MALRRGAETFSQPRDCAAQLRRAVRLRPALRCATSGGVLRYGVGAHPGCGERAEASGGNAKRRRKALALPAACWVRGAAYQSLFTQVWQVSPPFRIGESPRPRDTLSVKPKALPDES